jgi:hypothetical protein
MPGFHCTTCGEFHDQLPMCFGSPAPALYYDIPEEECDERVQLSSDQCIIDGEHFFLLGRLILKVRDAEEDFVWLTWVSVSEGNFHRACDVWETPGREKMEPPYFVWIQSALPYPGGTLTLSGKLYTQPLGQRPVIILDEADHPLVKEQHQGIDMARVHEIVEAAMHGE